MDSIHLSYAMPGAPSKYGSGGQRTWRHARAAFTLIELLVVVAMIAVVMGAISTSFSAARTRAKIEKATSEVKVISQAILSYETWNSGELQEMNDTVADGNSLGFLLGRGSAKGPAGTSGGGDVPALLMAQIKNGGAIVDPWGTPYRITIRGHAVSVKFKTVTGALNTGYYLPNLYRNTEGGL